MTALRISESLTLPIDFVTQTAAILAQRRKGKTYTGAVFAEELYEARLPWVAMDPTGAWWGLRSSADGERAGIPAVVIGGQHGDLPLDAYAGKVVADLVLDHPGWYVIDLSLLEGRPAERQFATDFGARLHRRKMQPGMDFPLHLFIDEADLFLPQEKEAKADVALLAAYAGIVRRGGLHGLGATLISQRPALINKSALTQLDLLVLLRLVAGNDQDAVYKNYVSRFVAKAQAAEIMDSLATLPVGDAWFLEPGADPPVIVRTRARARLTFNSSATPKPGEKRIEPKVFAQIDLSVIAAQMSETVERAKEDDPVELRKRIRVLEAGGTADAATARIVSEVDDALRERGEPTRPGESLADAVRRALEERPEPERVEVPVKVVSHADLDAASDLVLGAKEAADHMAQVGKELAASITAACQPLAAAIVEATEEAARTRQAPPARRTAREERGTSRPEPTGNGSVGTSAAPQAVRRADGVTAPQQKVLDALAWWERVGVGQPTLGQVGFVVVSHPRSKGFTNNLSALSSGGLLERFPGRLSLTQEGRDVANFPSARPTEADLHRLIYEQVGGKRAKILQAVIGRGSTGVSMDELAEEMGYHPRSKGFTNNVSTLSGLGLLDRSPGWVAASELCFL